VTRYGTLVVVGALLYGALYFSACFTLAQYELRAVLGALRSAVGSAAGHLPLGLSRGGGESDGGPTQQPDPSLVKP
jgi:hypothetical protein